MTGPRPGHAYPVRTLKSNSILIIMLPSSAPHFFTAPRAPGRGARAPRAGHPGAPANRGQHGKSEPHSHLRISLKYYFFDLGNALLSMLTKPIAQGQESLHQVESALELILYDAGAQLKSRLADEQAVWYAISDTT